MRLGNYLWVFAFLSLSDQVFAVDYYWKSELHTGSAGGSSEYRGASPAAVCAQIASAGWPFQYVSSGSTRVSSSNFTCDATRPADGAKASRNVYRFGDSCPTGAEFDSATGECKAPDNPCLVKAGVEERFSKSGTAPDEFVSISGGGYAIPQRQGCKGGCATEVTDIRGKASVSGAYLYTGSAVYSGQQCATTGTGDQFVEDEGQNVEPQVIKEEQPCVYSADGDKQVCQSGKSEEQEGRSCGTVNGVETCVSTVPAKNGIDIRTQVTKQILADGSTITTKKDIATVTSCKGVNNCTTSTATTTTTTKTDANGNKTGESSNCTGAACGSSSNPDADGDGVGECKPGDECSPEGSGEGQDWYEPGEDTFASVLSGFAEAVKQTPIASQTTSFLTFQASGSCPQWSISVWIFDIDIDQLCSGKIPWDAIKAVIIAAAAFLAFRIALF